MAEHRAARDLTVDEVVNLARQYLAPRQPRDYRLEVLPDGTRQEDDWWYVLVRPNRDDVRAYDYYDRLAEAEVALRDEQDVNVLLVPVLPE
jgi:hypothetical protein